MGAVVWMSQDEHTNMLLRIIDLERTIQDSISSINETLADDDRESTWTLIKVRNDLEHVMESEWRDDRGLTARQIVEGQPNGSEED